MIERDWNKFVEQRDKILGLGLDSLGFKYDYNEEEYPYLVLFKDDNSIDRPYISYWVKYNIESNSLTIIKDEDCVEQYRIVFKSSINNVLEILKNFFVIKN